MPEKHAVILAVETYQDKKIGSVQFAENDAIGLAETLKQHGFENHNITILLSSEATKTRLESLFRNRFASLEQDDQLILFYAGHGFADGGKNYITSHDTVLTDLTETSIELQSLLTAIRSAKCKRALLLLDSCHSGLPIDECMRGLLSDMTDAEFEDFSKESDYHIALASSEHDEVSYSSSKLKHGIWSYHVIVAFSGQAKAALERDRFLTISSLQNYLSSEVPRTLRRTLTGERRQTPRSWGNLSREALLADFTKIFAAREMASKSILTDMKRASLFGYDVGTVRSLSGFNKRFHHVPDAISDATRSFVQRIGSDEISNISKDLFNKLRSNFGYKRKDVDLDKDEGSASIMTPDFTVNVSIDIDEEDPGGYVLTTEVTEIQNYSAIETEAFSNVFNGRFDRVVFEFGSAVDLEEVIDKIEDFDNEDLIKVNYPADMSYCEVRIDGLDGILHCTRHALSFVRKKKADVKTLLIACRELPKLLSDHGAVGLLPAAGD